MGEYTETTYYCDYCGCSSSDEDFFVQGDENDLEFCSETCREKSEIPDVVLFCDNDCREKSRKTCAFCGKMIEKTTVATCTTA